jgi:uncharacterized integral membrane protein
VDAATKFPTESDAMQFLSMIGQNWRTFVSVCLGGLLGAFALQNMASVELTFLFWTFESRRIVVIAASLFVGFVVGWFVGYARGGSPDDDRS